MIHVVIAACGDRMWETLAHEHAYPSVQDQADSISVIYDPDATVAEARNRGAAEAPYDRPWLLFLDADDELAPGYIAAMEKEIRAGRAWWPLLTPRVSYVGGGRAGAPFFHPEVAPQDGNWLVIGTVVHQDAFNGVGGFEEWPIYEDWALFARLQKAGGEVIRVPDAIYRAHRPTRGRRSRNHSLTRAGKLQQHDRIRRAVWPELYESEEARA